MYTEYSLTEGKVIPGLVRFSLPLMIGNILQQFYNIADTLIVGRFIGDVALAAVGSSYTLMVFLTSILIGLCMGSGTYLSIRFGSREMDSFEKGSFASFVLIAGVTVVLNVIVVTGIDTIMRLMQIPGEVYDPMREYLGIIFIGLFATFLYNYFANCLRSVGNSMIPLIFLCVSALLNIGLDILFITVFGRGVRGAAEATVVSQYVSAFGILLYYCFYCPALHVKRRNAVLDCDTLKSIMHFSLLTCMQQSIMNLGILMVQGLVNSFGTAVMAAFAAAVKIDTLAYSPVQDFGNAFSTFVAQNYGAKKQDRISLGLKKSVQAVFLFCVAVSAVVFLFAEPLMACFVDPGKTEIICIGAQYLRIEGVFYFLIGLLFLFYGYFRAIEKPMVSVVLTVVSLGTRVVLAYSLSSLPALGVSGIWMSVPIGWFLADAVGTLLLMRVMRERR